MSIIEKALDKALGRAEEAGDSPKSPVQENAKVFVATGQDQLASAEETPPVEASRSTPPEAETQEAEEELIHGLDWDVLQAYGFLSRGTPENALANAYRRIAQPVQLNGFPDGNFRLQRGNLVLVTSSRSGEGKTFTAVNLALSVATEQPHRKVLLIDADAANTSLSRLFGLGERPGLSNVLESTGKLAQRLPVKTDLPTLRILPFGSAGQKGPALLGGAAMAKLAKELSRLYPDQLIIIDGPPLLETAEAVSLANQVGQVLLVVEAEATPQVIVQEAVAKLQYCNVVGCILNKATEIQGSGDLSFGYGLYRPGEREG